MSLVSVLESKDLSTVARRLNALASRLSPEANDSDAGLIVGDALQHMDALMSTCRAAIADGHVGAVEASLSVIRHIVDAEPQGFARCLVEHGMRQFHALASFFTPVVGHGTFGPQAAVMMMHVVQLLGAEPMAKDVAGDALAGPLTQFLAAGLPHVTDPHLLKRRAVSCLLNLVQGHAENKERLRRYLPQLSRVVVAASEFFLQVQAAELVWRITRVHKAWLADPAVAAALGSNLQKELSGLAANDRLLDNLIAVLQAHNDAAPESPSNARIVSLRCDSVEARLREGGEEVKKTHPIATTTTAFLSQSALVVLLPNEGPCAQLTVPLHTFASAKLRTDGCFIIRLSDAPLTANAAATICDFAPNDYLALALAGPALPRARAIPLRSWIVRAQGDEKALREAYEAAIRAPRPSAVPVGDAGGAASPAQGATSLPASAPPAQQTKSAPVSRAPSKQQTSPPQRREREEPQPSYQDPTSNGLRSAILSANPSRMPSAAPAAGTAPAASSMPPPDVPPARRPPMAERPGNATVDTKAPPPVRASGSAPTSRAPSASRLPVFDFDRALSSASGADMPPAQSALRVTTPSFASHQQPQQFQGQQQQQHYAAPSPSEVMRSSTSSNFAGDAVEHFRKAIADRVAEKRGHTDQVLQWVLTSVQRNVDATKDANRRDRDNLEMLVQEELRALRVHESEVKEHIGLRVKELDAALSELRTVSNVVAQRIEALSQRANEATAEARACESASLHELKRRVDADLATLEDTLYRAASHFEPREFVDEVLNQNPHLAAH